jgi:Gram-negative porin
MRGALVALGLLGLAAGSARADVTLTKFDNWELYTNGRVNLFVSYGTGDSNPVPESGEFIPLGGGLNTEYDNIPRRGPDGMILPGQGTFISTRLRSGFVPSVLSVGLRGPLSERTTFTTYVSFWATIETESQRKTSPNVPTFQEGYVKLEAPWGTVVAGRSLALFSRGAVETDYLYGHGFGVGFPGNINDRGPTTGLIGFGVLAAFFSPGLMYATPELGGLQLSVGAYDPTPIPGNWEQTRYPRPETELTFRGKLGPLAFHLFGNGAYQKLYNPGSIHSETMAGVGYGGRLELGPVHLGTSGHYGKGLGLAYALQGGAVSVGPSPLNNLRTFDGYSVLGQVVLGKVDVNLGWGMSRTYRLQSDIDSGTISILKRQMAFSAVVVYHHTPSLHLALDYLHGDARWFLGESQTFDFLTTGATATW